MSYYVETLDQVFLGRITFVFSGFGLCYGAFSLLASGIDLLFYQASFIYTQIKTGNSVAL